MGNGLATQMAMVRRYRQPIDESRSIFMSAASGVGPAVGCVSRIRVVACFHLRGNAFFFRYFSLDHRQRDSWKRILLIGGAT